MSALTRFRDVFRKFIPNWLADRRFAPAKRFAGFGFLWSMIAPLDTAMQVILEGVQAAWPGKGTPSALPYIGRSRLLIRGQGESDTDYAAYLRTWLELHPLAGSQKGIALVLHNYLGNKPRVRVISRAGHWVTVEEDGTVTEEDATWDWDSVSNPERNDVDAPYWSDLFVVIYPTQWSTRVFISDLDWNGTGGLGHDVTREEVDAVRGLFAQWKGAHNRIRAVIWTTNGALFDPSDDLTKPDGTWGWWSDRDNTYRQQSGRNRSDCRIWEPNQGNYLLE